MYNPDMLWEMMQLHKRELLDEAAQARAAQHAQHAQPHWAARLLISVRTVPMIQIAARVFERPVASANQLCCTQPQ